MKKLLTIAFSLMVAFPAMAQVTSTPGVNGPVRQQIQSARENFEMTVKARRAELQSAITASREELKTKLKNIKDERKKAAVERIDKNIADLNSRMMTHYVNVLNQIDDVLKRVISRTDKVQASGKDVAAVRTAITNAQNAIAAARTAVAAQVSKVYSMNITSDTKLKTDVGATRQALLDDLKKVGDSVKAAREAVRQAAVNLAQIQGIDKLKTPTSTATSTDR